MDNLNTIDKINNSQIFQPPADVIEEIEKIPQNNPPEDPTTKISETKPINIPEAKVDGPNLTERSASIKFEKYTSQRIFMKEVLGMVPVECGGGGDCFVYSVASQIEECRILGSTEGMKKLRRDVSAYAHEKHGAYKSGLKQKLETAQNRIHEQLSPEEQKKCEADIKKYTALLKDAEKDEQAIRDLSNLHQTLDACGEEGKWITEFYGRTLRVFSEYNPHSNENTIGAYFSRFPGGNATMDQYADQSNFSADDIFIYHIGNDKGGHYQAITKLKS